MRQPSTAAGVVVAIVAVLLTVAPDPARGAVTGQVGTFNLAGNVRDNEGRPAVADDVVGSMLDREIDDLGARTGEPTHADGKLDYIFFTRNLRWHGGDATRSKRSDHAPLWGTLTIP